MISYIFKKLEITCKNLPGKQNVCETRSRAEPTLRGRGEASMRNFPWRRYFWLYLVFFYTHYP